MSLSIELKEMLDPGTLVPGIVAGVFSITFMFSYSAVIWWAQRPRTLRSASLRRHDFRWIGPRKDATPASPNSPAFDAVRTSESPIGE